MSSLRPSTSRTMASPESHPLRPRSSTTDLFRFTMNRFLNKKKAPEASSNDAALLALSAPAPPTSPNNLKKSATRRWRKKKEQLEQPMPEFNITGALPSSDDFRTSLLMPNLSARFSMLRDQDDPNSLLGKASDDSVLQPRRKSRMSEFGFGAPALGDIDEVASIESSIRPPFAYTRQHSFASEEGYGSENESSHNSSVLSRARPGEGNILFGGRQKVYMVPKAGSNSTRSLGKVVYEDDIGVSPFQKYRRDRDAQEGRQSDESQGFDFGVDQAQAGGSVDPQSAAQVDSAKHLSHSPSTSSSEKKRSTTSTSHSDAPSSTAGTSVASQPPTAQSQPKGRKLYEKGFDQHMQDQQASAMNRLNSTRQRTGTGSRSKHPQLHGTRSAGTLNERAPQRPLYALRAQSPPIALRVASPNLGAGGAASITSSPTIGSRPQSPISPTGFEMDENSALSRALEPGDRGKATAMGAFNKPSHAFDEKQYLERQRLLQRSNSSALAKKDASAVNLAQQQRLGRFEEEREPSESNASANSRSPSSSNNQETNRAFNVFQRAANQMVSQVATQQSDKPALPDTHRTFFGNISASESEEDDDDGFRRDPQKNGPSDSKSGPQSGRWQSTMLPSVSEHPALRPQKSQVSLAEAKEMEPTTLRSADSMQSVRNDVDKSTVPSKPCDSPTLGPSAAGLNGMMHHLRQKSDQSSIYAQDETVHLQDAPAVPEWNPKNLDLIHSPSRNLPDPTARIESACTSSNPWDLDEIDNAYHGGDVAGPVSPLTEQDSRTGPPSRVPSNETSHEWQSDISPFETQGGDERFSNDAQSGHARDASTATQLERDAFTSELAARRAAIQENMRSMTSRDNSSRNASPAPSSSGTFKAFGMLRQKSSKESVANSASGATAPKASKLLGLSGSSRDNSSQYERSGHSMDMHRGSEDPGQRPLASSSQPSFPPPDERIPSNESGQSRSRGGSASSRLDTQHYRPMRSPAPANAPFGARSRANSEVNTGRSTSRSGQHREEAYNGAPPGLTGVLGPPPAAPREPKSRPSDETLLEAARATSNGKSSMVQNIVHHIDSRNQVPPVPQPSRDRLASAGGPSPPSLHNASVYSPAASSGHASPGTSPFSQNVTPPVPSQFMMTPPISGNSTPLNDAFGAPPSISSHPNASIYSRPGGSLLRKKTISKSDISEPTLTSSTSNIDTVDLPEGASLKNGMENPAMAPPPVPPINPRRRAARQLFGLGRKESDGSRDASPAAMHSPVPDLDSSIDQVAARRNRSGSRSPYPGGAGQPSQLPPAESPSVRQYAVVPGGAERVQRSPGRPFSPVTPQSASGSGQGQVSGGPMEGGMF